MKGRLSRPDIMWAEHQFRSANANIGAHRVAFFPRILLTGFADCSSVHLSDLFFGDATAWNFSPQIILPIFEGGINRASLDVAQVGKLVEFAQYERSIQTAFREVADALAARHTLDQQIEAEEALVEAEQKPFTLAEARYRSGVERYITGAFRPARSDPIPILSPGQPSDSLPRPGRRME